MTAADAKMGIIYRAAVFAQERHDIVAAVIDDIEQFDMVDSKAVSGAVADKDFTGILDPELLLIGVARTGKVPPQMSELPPRIVIFSISSTE